MLTELGFPNKLQQTVGEILLLSALPNEETIITCSDALLSGPLGSIFTKHSDLFFNSPFASFPLLLKILLPATDLSIQVHPNDEYAQTTENAQFGKEESWVCLSARPQQKIICGHFLNNSTEMASQIKQKNWNNIFRKISITKNDLINIPPGTIHAVLAGTVVYELQQNSDLTYRLYDYNRLTAAGVKRPLQIKKALSSIYYPQLLNDKSKLTFLPNSCKLLLKNKHYLLSSLWIKKIFLLPPIDNALIGTVVEGECYINSKVYVTKFQTFILSRKTELPFVFKGNAKILLATISNS